MRFCFVLIKLIFKYVYLRVIVIMENCDFLLWINKRRAIKISWSGNDDCFAKNKQNILEALGNGTLQWSRESKSTKIPLNLQFPICFENYNAENYSSNKSNGNAIGVEPTFLHLHFVNVSNSEEYRITVRPEISEWFANLNEAGCQNWIIIFDSSRAKDRKNKTMIIDKLKSDFARFQNRLFESSEIGLSEKVLASLSSLLQRNFFDFLENYVSISSANIQRLKATINENTFSPSALINEQLNLAFFYWNFGLFEVASNELDSLSTFLDDSILALAQNDNAMNAHVWLKQLRLLPFDKFCPLLSVQMFTNFATDDWSLVKIHAHLLAHQILLSTQLLNHRLEIATAAFNTEKPAENQPNALSQKEKTAHNGQKQQQLNTLQIRHDFLKTILSHTRRTFQRLEENLLVLKANYSPILLHCLFVVWHLEVFKIGQNLLGNETNRLEEVNSAASHIAFLLHKQCEAIIYLNSIIANKRERKQEITIASRWLEQTPLTLSPTSTADSMFSTTKTTNDKIEQFFEIFKKFMKIFNYDEKKFDEYFQRELTGALAIFRKFGWNGHVKYLEHHLAKRNSNQMDSYKIAKKSILKFIGGENLLQFGEYSFEYLDGELQKYKMEMLKFNPDLLFECCLIMLNLIGNGEEENERRQQIEAILAEISSESIKKSTPIIRKNYSWLTYEDEESVNGKRRRRPIIPFPIQIVHTSPSLLHCILNRPDSLEIELKNNLPINLDGCKIWAKFLKLTKQSRASQSRHIIFRRIQSTMATNLISVDSSNSNGGTAFYNLEYLSPLNESIPPKDEAKEGEKLEAKIVDAYLQPGKTKHTLQINAGKNVVGCFRLDSIKIEYPKMNCTFLLNYGEEMNRNQRLEQIICFADIIKPSIAIFGSSENAKKESNTPLELVSGMAQQFWVELNPGTISLEHQTNLSISLVDIKNANLFKLKDSTSEWTNDSINLKIPPLGPNQMNKLCVDLCLNIDRIVTSVSAMDSPPDENESTKIELKLEWTDGNKEKEMLTPQLFLPINFQPIFTLASSTSFLAENVIFILDLRRGPSNSSIQICPLEADLCQEQNIALEPIQAKLLNPKPFKFIVANSTFRFIWKLPDSSFGKSIPIPHFFELKYYVEEKGKENVEKEKNFNFVKKRMDFPIQKVEYEICASFYSEHSQSVLCRIDQPCDLVVSIRSLAKLIEAETVIVSIDDEMQQYWRCMDRQKLVKVKESGVGQAIFNIVPKMLGFLPFPPITIHKYKNADQSPPSRQNHSSTAVVNPKRIGDRLISFYRNKGSQIHILAPIQHMDETISMGSTNASSESSEQKKKSLKSQAKDRLQKLFE